MEDNIKITPMYSQFLQEKKNYPDAILFFRMGDFYEMFGEDAKIASKILNIALTARNKNEENPIPMCGIPYHSYIPYLKKLVDAGYKVAICEQLEDPKNAKGIVKRGVVRVVTPGTLIEDDILAGNDFNFILSFEKDGDIFYAVVSDTSTGDTFVTKSASIEDIITQWSPKEIITTMNNPTVRNATILRYRYNYEYMLDRVADYYEITSTIAIGIREESIVKALFNLIKYIDDNLLDVKLKFPEFFTFDDTLYMDAVAIKTLEVVESSDPSGKTSLFDVLNFCKTAMGERLLKFYLLTPTRLKFEILRRQEWITFFVNNSDLIDSLSKVLSEINDIERIITRISAKKGSPRDLVGLKNSLKQLPQIKKILKGYISPILQDFLDNFDDLKDIYQLIDNAISDDPPLNIKDCGVIKDGYSSEVDELRGIRKNSQSLLLKIENEEKEKTGISTLKVRYNKVFGYYIEISKGQAGKVPDYYERRQTLVNAERFITPELKKLEEKILTAEERLQELEYEIFCQIRDDVSSNSSRIRYVAQMVAEIDFFISAAFCAIKYNYVRPEVGDFEEIKIIDGRHPVIERRVREGFVPNDILLDGIKNRLMIITGPNMSGKSTYLRTAAVITLMAHCGLFVPAREAKIGFVDRIFTRVGASDNLARGESTFMVEMLETANILKNATSKSLIILDEIGRGTSTFDGLSIAWSVAEYIAERIKAKTLFATHYHELTELESMVSGVKNYTALVKEWKNEIIFMRKIAEGVADRSYGIYVAKLAGLPEVIVSRAEEVLSILEKHEISIDGSFMMTKRKKSYERTVIQPMLLFEEHPIITELKSINPDELSPKDALELFYRIREKLDA
ncbi:MULTISPECIES: DNA mismatch repair protein MutS [Calditerrivibrio]|uniref:DNA mismatch repair protein MutS n=1 Tax=Calditerrivibrio nitroreducens TaxID=477976 RepID=A0A2J6WKF5_9BACT|nr:MAG: DNA mismatch repair protein MutS [Calditerrivibrio nitroreducens]